MASINRSVWELEGSGGTVSGASFESLRPSSYLDRSARVFSDRIPVVVLKVGARSVL